MRWREFFLESHSLAVLSAAGVALLAFPGAELARSAQPRLARVVAPAPTAAPDSEATPSKGPASRMRGSAAASRSEPAAQESPRTAAAPAAQKSASAAPVPQPAPTRLPQAFDACFYSHEQLECRRRFEAVIERHGGLQLAAAGERLGSQPIDSMPSLDFDEAPQWRRRVESLADDGLAFKRVRRGRDHELVIGLTSQGLLGFSLEEKASGY